MEFLTLFAMAMDYLPIQATSVPCEHVFSSAKETDTIKQNQISSVLMEAIQLLKFSLKTKCLNFIKGCIMSEVAMNEAPMPSCNLDSLFGDDPNTALDKILKEFGNYDCKTASIDTPLK
jgi:hAT family protein